MKFLIITDSENTKISEALNKINELEIENNFLQDEISELKVKYNELERTSNQRTLEFVNIKSIVYSSQRDLATFHIEQLGLRDLIERLIKRNKTEKQRTKNHTKSFLKLHETVDTNFRRLASLALAAELIAESTNLILNEHADRIEKLELDVDLLCDKFNTLNI